MVNGPDSSSNLKHLPIVSMKRVVHAFERLLLLLVGSAMLGAWVAAFLRTLSDSVPLCELFCHPSLHILAFTTILLGVSGFFWFLRRNSVFSGARWRRRFIATLFPFLFYTWVTMPWCLLPLVSSEESTNGIKILSWNVQIGNDNGAMILDLVNQESPDIVVLIELTPFVANQIEDLKQAYPFHLIKPHRASAGMAVYSRLPNSAFKEIQPGGYSMPAIELIVQRKNQNKPDLALLCVHTLSPHLDDGLRIVHRNEQLEEVANWADNVISETKSEAVAIGDFNITPWSPPFWRLLEKGKLVDSTWYRGYFPTWPAGLHQGAIPIDHALVSRGLKILDRKVLPDTYLSDHRPITITIE